MKKTTLIIALFMSIGTFAQTDVISVKSHSGNLAKIKLEKDNFGMPSPRVDSVIYLSEECLIQVMDYYSGDTYHDTVCRDNWRTPHISDLKELKKHYASNVIFVGFKEADKLRRSNNSNRQNGINWFFGLIIISFMAYVSFPLNRKKQH